MVRFELVFISMMLAASAAGPAGFFPQPYYYSDYGNSDELAYLKAMQKPQEVPPSMFSTDGQGVGSVSGVDVDSNGDLFLFHRADHTWTYETFDDQTNVLTEPFKRPIQNETIFKVNPTTGKVISKLGANLFNVPHGLSIDANDSLWVTDVGRHQVFRIPKDSNTPDLVLGEKFVPGNDQTHFCKPTDVAAASNGQFFVSDGYCNNRILKFDADGKFLTEWGTKAVHGGMNDFTLDIPHSLILIEELDLVCVADRENQRALCYDAGVTSNRQTGTFNRTLIKPGEMGKVFALYYNKAEREVEAAAVIAFDAFMENGMAVFPPRAFSYSLKGEQLQEWAYITMATHMDGPSMIHDLCTSKDGQDFFLADVDQKRVLKYSKRSAPAVI